MITKNYVKMCEKAEEIQRLRQYKEGGWFYTKHGYHRISDDFIYFITDEDVNDNWITRIGGVWLPTQEQLQEMVDWKDYDIKICWNCAPYKFYWKRDPLKMYGVNGNSMNELWLAFVMKEKFSKQWSNGKWT